jgi:dihydroflavonol-4-reductase
MDRNIFNERFILSAGSISYTQLFGSMAKYLGKPAPSVRIPDFVTALVWRLETARTFITHSTPFLTKEIAHNMWQNYTYTNEKIRKTLDFEFLPIEQSIREICEIYLKENSEIAR